MEFTNEIKAKVFSGYYGEFYVLDNGTKAKMYGQTINHIKRGKFESAKLILKPLSAVTDEDAIEVQKILGSKIEKKSKYFFEMVNATTPENAIEIYQFLQYKGYDMPHYLLGGQTLQEVGLAIYEK